MYHQLILHRLSVFFFLGGGVDYSDTFVSLQLEPTWNELEKRVRTLGVVVGRIDATRFEELAHQFEIRGFPTLIFFKG